MRRFLVVSMVFLLALAIAVPSFALELKWGGLWRTRVISQQAFTSYNYSLKESTTYATTASTSYTNADGSYSDPAKTYYTTAGTTNLVAADGDDLAMGVVPVIVPLDKNGKAVDRTKAGWNKLVDQNVSEKAAYAKAQATQRSIAYKQHLNRFDQRLRMFIDFISSENLKVVTKFETNAVWGSAGSSTFSAVDGNKVYTNNSGSGNVGADSGTLNVKNVYVDFKIPQTPLQAKVGVQGIALVDSWIVDTDLSAALLTADLKPFTVTLGYISGQNFDTYAESENIDDLAAVVSFKQGPFSASLVGLWQDAHNTPASVYPQVAGLWDDPLQKNVQSAPFAYPSPWGRWDKLGVVAENNQLFDLGLQLGYKSDYLGAYLNFVKNFGSVKLAGVNYIGTAPAGTSYTTESSDYTGWMIDAGVSYFCGPWTVNVGGFYTSGGKVDQVRDDDTGLTVLTPHNNDISWFVYPLSTSKYFSEIMGGGILDNTAPNGGYWRGYPAPSNLWTVTAGGAWQVMPSTKIALSWWYFGTSEKVPSRYYTNTGTWEFDSYLGNEIDLNITQNIVDKLNLDLVGAYMFTGDAYRA